MILHPRLPFAHRRRPQPTPTMSPLTVTSVDDLVFNEEGGSCLVSFNLAPGATLIEPEASNPAKWTARVAGFTFVGQFLERFEADFLRVSFAVSGTASGADVLSYSADPSDIEDSTGRELEAFANRPL